MKTFIPGFNVICTGKWAGELPAMEVQAWYGHGIVFKTNIDPEIIRPSRVPFRMEKFINRNIGESWYSNSLAVTENTYKVNAERYQKEIELSARKIGEIYGISEPGEYCYGIRPLTATHSNRHIKNGIVITGGYKSGMVHYPIQCMNAIDYMKAQGIC